MDKNQGYAILKAVMLENGRGFALGEHPRAPSPFVTWACYDDEHGARQYEWGHYGSDRAALEQDLLERVESYQQQFSVKVAHIEAPGLRPCAICGRLFVPEGKRAFCSAACAENARRKRQRGYMRKRRLDC